jgi:chromosome segregation ATPase
LKTFDSIVWNELKQFWAKVQDQVRERNLFRDHANNLRNQTNDLFTSLKSLRKTLDDDFKRISKENSAKFSTSLQTIEEKISGGLGLQPLFEELKKLQKEFKDTKFTKDDRAAIWNRLDKAFKDIKEKRFGKSNNKASGSSPLDRLQRRYDGLLSAIKKMENSIDRDKREIRHQDDRISKTDGQLEAQLRQAKIKMTNERIRSKEEKLSEMMRTKTDLDKRFEIEKAKEAKRQERLKIENKKKEVEAKIAAEIKEKAEKRKDEDGKLIKAATAIATKPKTATEQTVVEKPVENEVPIEKVVEKPSEETAAVESIAESAENMVDKVSTMISETLEDVVDTVKAVAEVIENKAEEVMDSINEEE